MSNSEFANVKTPQECVLRKKEIYEYVTPENTYNVELFENPDGTFYAIGVPRDDQRLIVYGSNIVQSKEQALQILVDKIRREGSLFGSSTETEDSDE